MTKTSNPVTVIIAAWLLAAGAQQAAAAPAVPIKPLTSMQKNIETAGTAVAIALPAVGGGIALFRHDWTGAAQLTVETVLTVGTAYALKNIVRERRPDGSDWHSFPSGTTALASSGSSFLWGRYGWEYGLPAFAATQFVSYSRIQAKQHHWYDTLASSAMGVGYGYFVTTRFHRRYDIYTDLDASPNGGFVSFAYKF